MLKRGKASKRRRREVCFNPIVAFALCQHLPVVSEDWKGPVLGGATILFDITKACAETFVPLKAVLGAISVVYQNYEVRLQPYAQNTSLTNSPAGNSCRQGKDSRPAFTHCEVRNNFQIAYK